MSELASPAAAGPTPAAKRREARVRLILHLRRALPGVAALLLLLCLAQATWRGLADPERSSGPGQPSRMIRPSFSGQSDDGQSYVVTGREAVREQAADGLILIAAPVVVLRSPQDKTTRMTAQRGVYDEGRNTLLMKGDVRVEDGGGSSFQAAQALVDTRTGAVSGRGGLRARNAAGAVTSQDYTVLDEGDRMILRGGVRGRLAR
jgi:lipopolysaccharide export system protein LptC